MRGTDYSSQPPSGPDARSEDARLDDAIGRADALLLNSLKADERRRRTRHRIYLTLGGLAMLSIICLLAVGLGMPEQVAFLAANNDESGQLSQEGWKLWQSQQFDEAAKKFEEAVKLAPKNTNAWNGLGWSRFNGGDPEAAEKAFKKVIALEPKHPAALNGLGQLALLEGNYKDAEKYLLKAAPQASAAWYGLARVYLLQGKYDQAKKWAKKLVDSGEADESAQQMLKAAEEKKLDPELRQLIAPPGAAKDDGDKPAGKSPAKPKKETASAESNPAGSGWRLFFQGRTTEAKELFEQALAEDPKNGAALNGLGWCLLNSGELDLAKQYFEKTIALDPDGAGALNGLARVLKAQDDVDGAIKIWEDMLPRFPGATAAVAGLAEAYVEKGEHKKALPLLEQLSKAEPGDEKLKEKIKQVRKQAE